jgi:Tol biopolymer transport system component
MVKQLSDADDWVTASLSPDGQFIAYSCQQKESGSTNSAQNDIRIINIDGSNDHSLIEHPANDVTPHWMPDGKHLLFVSDRSGSKAVWMVPISQGQQAGEPRMVRDSLTGRLLGTADDGTAFYSARSPSFNIYVADVDFDNATIGTPKIVSLRYDGKNRLPRWSADGSKLAYSSDHQPSALVSAFVFQDAVTGKEEAIECQSAFFATAPAWSPDLSRLVGPKKSDTQKGRSLFEVETKTGRQSLLKILSEPNDDVGKAIFTPDGKFLIYPKFSWTEGKPADGLVELDLATGRERLISRELAFYNRALAISPDGSRLAVCNFPYPIKEGDKVKLLVASRADGSTKTVAEFAISETGRGQVCEWLPDNRRVIVAFEGKHSQQLYLVDTESGSSRPFGPPQPQGEPITTLSIHPDGKRIAFERGREIREIWAMRNLLPEKVTQARTRLQDLNGEAQPDSSNGQPLIRKLPSEKFGKWVTDPGTRPSPDGRYLAFVNWSFGNLAVYDATTSESRDLTTDGTWDPKSRFCDTLVWSPDGQQLAYVWFKEDEGVDLRVIDRNGGKPRIVVSFDKDDSMEANAWSGDGRYIVGPATKTVGTNKVFRIVLVEVATGAVRVLKELPEAKGWFRLALSPDDRQIVYCSPAGQLRALTIDNLDDRVLMDNPAGTRDPVWVPNGRHLLFKSTRSGTESLWALPVNQGEASGAPILIHDGFFHTTLWGCTADGTLYWLTTTPRANIFIADADFAAGTIRTPRQVSLRFDGRSRHPRWSADGSELTYVSRQFPGAQEATHVIHEIASGKERDVKIPALWYGAPPQWSADFRKLYAPAVVEGRGAAALFCFDAQTGQATLLAEDQVGLPNLSPEGSHLIYLRRNSSGAKLVREIIERDLKSGQERVIRRSDHIPVGPNPLLSRDGSRVAHMESDGTNALLQIISRADGATKTVWETVAWEKTGWRKATILDWLPDNRQVLLSVEDNHDTQQLLLVDTETKSHRPFNQSLRGEERILQLSIHPDGKRIAFCRDAEIKEIWTMKNLLPDERRAAK